jgi:4'-phosphopantetheinyl transferase
MQMNTDACPAGTTEIHPGISPGLPAITPISIDSLREVFGLWDQCDILVMLGDSRSVLRNHAEILDCFERSTKDRYITQYARHRYAASRTLAKLALVQILQKNSPEDITLRKEPTGGIGVAGEGSVFLCISYTHNLLAIAFARMRVGIDIEHIRPLALRHSPSLVGTICGEDAKKSRDSTAFLQHWTALEACAKYSNIALWKMLQSPQTDRSVYSATYSISGSLILSLVTEAPCPPHRMRWVMAR